MGAAAASGYQTPVSAFTRIFCWSVVSGTLVFALNNYLIFWLNWPGMMTFLGDLGLLPGFAPQSPLDGTAATLGAVQTLSYLICVGGAALYTMRTPDRLLRQESEAMVSVAAYIIRASFWAVIFVGLADMVISFLRVEGLLPVLFGDALATELGRPQFRGGYVHIPLVLAGCVTAAFSRSLGFTWLALLVVAAELSIVLSRFIFSYEQAFQGDLVRFWYGALFLFASAYTLYEDGHVRVDVVYAGLSSRMKGLVNIWGSLLLGMTLCVTVLAIGMAGKSSIINSALLSFEVSQSGFGMYVKYLMAGFLGIFAITMMIQFAAYILESLADYRDEPGKRQIAEASAH
ncbi:MAG: TRAP transporter small permease subunit [Nisaea sp.]|uniref:TRAP transporter small permease subunit n=1 Tax=Nisaea sp. TaxID=2024842 RepID=UPI001B1615A8|nr:TRAP transporter small permease subunit [Nisaea sp.]MBO6562662.1 TRAP transporter small permease subunit [Nisaea sp.]